MSLNLLGTLARASAVTGLCLGLALAPVSPAGAAPATPSSLTSTNEAIPELSWAHVAGATSYVVEVSLSPDTSGLIGSSTTTVNRHHVPTAPLPTPTSGNTLWWRVAARDTALSEFSPWTAISRDSAYTAPSVISPSTGHTFVQPGSPATLSWQPVAGTQEYEVQVSTDQSFTDPTKLETFKTISTTLILPKPQVATSYWFQVRSRLSSATSGPTAVYTQYSSPRSYSVSALPAATRRDPVDDTTIVDDAFLDWDPILGAKTYDLQIATDPAFGSIVHEKLKITGTSYARPATLNNDTYYWRVRAEDVAGNVPTWSSRPTWRFTRDWPDLPMPIYPANPADVDPATPNDNDQGVVVGGTMYYEWEPVRFASMYQLELSTDSTFSSIVGTCYTANTTYTPAAGTFPNNHASCMPSAEGTYWWRVTAMDQFSNNSWLPYDFPRTSQLVFNDARFTYSPDRPNPLSPTNGATVQVPTLTWSPVAGAATYRVKVINNVGTQVATVDTAATSWTPTTTRLTSGTYRWDVVAISNQGWVGSSLLSGQPSFVVADLDPGTATRPDVLTPMSGTFARVPKMTWTSVADASSYKIWIRQVGSSAWDVLSPTYPYPAGTDHTTAHLAPGSYEWQVRATVPTGETSSQTFGRFDIASPDTVTGQVNALTMRGANAGQTCTGFECTDLRQTPVLKWDPEPNTGFYKIWVSRNASLSNLVPATQLGTNTNPFTTSGTAWSPTKALEDSTAGEAYYWAVQPCSAGGKCAANPTPLNSFNKASNRVESVGPGVEVINGVPQGPVPVKSDDVTLEWQDYLETNTQASQGSSQLATKAAQAAREYEVQISSDDTFANLLDSQVVDQRRYTSFSTTYPEGNVYWRVRAVDGSGNPLPWSRTRGFNKQSPVPSPSATSSTQGSTPTLSWAPLPFAAAYEIEVYVKGASVPKYTVTSNQVQWSPSTTAQSLAPGDYEWRVRRKDAKDRVGGWSSKADLTVTNVAPTLTAPSPGGGVAPRDAVFRWSAVSGATDYRVTLTSPTGTTLTALTKATSWAPTTKLASGNWSWRVETRDTSGTASAQSASQPFVVTDDVMASSPPRIEGSGELDTMLLGYAPVWNQEPDSVTYQWYRGSTAVGDGTLSYQVTGADLNQRITLKATATTAGYPDVSTTSNAITAVRGAAPVATTPPTIIGSAMVGETVSGGLPTWASPDVTTTQRWLVNGINSGTGPTFTVRTFDLGKQLTFEVTGRRTGYADAVVASAPVTVQAGGSLQATTQPTIIGTSTVGQSLRVAPGTWSQSSPTFAYQWLRTGAPIPGATSPSYLLKPEDAGRDVAVVVLATKVGFNDGSATTAAVAVARMKSTIAGSLKSERVKVGRRAKLGITLSVPGLTTPVGKIQVLDKGKKIKQFTMSPVHKGTKTIKLRKLPRGKHKLKVVYVGTGQVFGSRSKRILLYVVRR